MSSASGTSSRARRFLRKPWREKVDTVKIRWAYLRSEWAQKIANLPRLIRLPFGALWLARADHIGQPILERRFELAEVAFVRHLLRPGMTVLDLGAHHGLYTLLGSMRVGSKGRVISFEPSPRERKALRFHVALNRCRNVTVQGFALSDHQGEGTLYLAKGSQTGCNSLKPPYVVSGTSLVRVCVTTLDAWLDQRGVQHVDFIKLDVEGGELDVLKGAVRLLERQPRPVILAEVQEVRTLQWGYRAKEIINYLANRGYKWFRLLADGSLEQLDLAVSDFEGNFVACPQESVAKLEGLRASSFSKVGP